MFDLEKFKTGEYYVHLPTLDLYKEVMKFLENNDFLWIGGEKPTETNFWCKYGEETSITYKAGIGYGPKDGMDYLGKEKMNLKGETNMNEKMKRDLIKLLFEKEFNVLLDLGFIMQYEGRVVTNSPCNTAKFIDFIDELNEEYGIKGHEVADIIIKEFDLEKFKSGDKVRVTY